MRRRVSKVVALNQIATVLLQKEQLFAGFDAFGDDDHFQSVRHGDDGARDGGVFGVLGQTADKTAVDLQRAHIEAF